MKIMKKGLYYGLFCALVFNVANGFAAADDHAAMMQLIGRQHQYEQQGKLYVEQGKYEKAIQQFDKAIELDIKINGGDRGRPMASKVRTLQYQNNYKAALELMTYLISAHSSHEHYEDWKEELEMLSIQDLTERNQKINAYIHRLKEKYAERLPPKGYWAYMEIPTILRLYDTIGDYDAGIKFVDEILIYLQKEKQSRKEDFQIYDHIKTSEEALQCAGLDKRPKDRHPEWRACKLISEYLLVREAFEREKANAGPTCGEWGSYSETPEGKKYCVGDATQALIQSDYFPW